MKILHLIYDDMNNPWLGGGGARRALEIYKRFPKDSIISIVTGKYPKSLSFEKIENVSYYRVGIAVNYLISRMTYSICTFFHILKNDYDIIVEDYSAFSPCFSFFLTKKPVIGSFQNLHSQKAAIGKGPLKTIGAAVFDKIALRFFKNITAVSPDLTNKIKTKATYKENIKFIGVGVDQSLFSINKNKTNENPYILYIGRLELFQKGIDILLKSFCQLKNKPKLIMAGAGVDIDRIKSIANKLNIENSLEIIGRFSQDQKIAILQNALFVVMPSRFEGFPVVPLEALASGNAFIGTDIPGTADIVKDHAILVEKENVNELTEAMQFLIDDKEKRRDMEINGRQFAKKYEWDAISKEYYEFIKTVYEKSITHKD